MKLYLVQYARRVRVKGVVNGDCPIEYRTDLAFECKQHAQEYRANHFHSEARVRIIRSSTRYVRRYNETYFNVISVVKKYPPEKC